MKPPTNHLDTKGNSRYFLHVCSISRKSLIFLYIYIYSNYYYYYYSPYTIHFSFLPLDVVDYAGGSLYA